LILSRCLSVIALIAKLYLEQPIALLFLQSRAASKCLLVTPKFILKRLKTAQGDSKPFVLIVELLFILPPKVWIHRFI